MTNENPPLTAANIRYLLTIDALSENGSSVRSADVASALGISRPSVHGMMNTLQALRLIQKKEYGRIQLTELGREMASAYSLYYREVVSIFHGLLTDESEIDEAVYAILSLVSQESLSTLCEKHAQKKAWG